MCALNDNNTQKILRTWKYCVFVYDVRFTLNFMLPFIFRWSFFIISFETLHITHHTHTRKKKPSSFRIQFCAYNIQQLEVKQQIVYDILNVFHENSN